MEIRYRNLAILKSRSPTFARGVQRSDPRSRRTLGAHKLPRVAELRGRGLPSGTSVKEPRDLAEDDRGYTHGSPQDPGNEGKVLFFRSFVRPFHPRYCGVPFVVYRRFPSPWISYIRGRLNNHDQRQNSPGKSEQRDFLAPGPRN